MLYDSIGRGDGEEFEMGDLLKKMFRIVQFIREIIGMILSLKGDGIGKCEFWCFILEN